MRLLYLHTAPVPSLSANAVQVAKMCDAFAGAGVETTLVCARDAGRAATFDDVARAYSLKRRFAVSQLALTKWFGSNMIFAVRAILPHRLRGPLTVYTRGVPIAYAAHLLGVPYVLEVHGPASAIRPVSRQRLARMCHTPRFLQLVAISDRLRADYAAAYPALAGRIVVAHDGADPFDATQALTARHLTGDFRVGYVGHLYPGKGMEIILPLAKHCRFATFHVVGGRAKDVAHWRAEAEGLTNIIFHGHVPHADTASYIAEMDVVLAPYQRRVSGSDVNQNLADWMSPLKMFEYMAQGKAILASDLPVLREVLKDGENALLCDPDDPAAWADALTGLAGQRQRLTELGEHARRDFLNGYSWDQRARHILKCLPFEEGLAT